MGVQSATFIISSGSRPGCEWPSAAFRSSEIAVAIPSSRTAASSHSRSAVSCDEIMKIAVQSHVRDNRAKVTFDCTQDERTYIKMLAAKAHMNLGELHEVIQMLCKKKKLPEKYKDYSLTGNYVRHRECHVKSDTLLIYFTDEIHLHLVRIDSHSELF